MDPAGLTSRGCGPTTPSATTPRWVWRRRARRHSSAGRSPRPGGDPRKADGRAVVGPTFAEAAEAVIAMHEPTWRSPKSGPQWRASLETYAYPTMGELPVSDITPGHVIAVLEPIWNQKRETARRVKQRISAICRWARRAGPPHGRSGRHRDRRSATAERGGTPAHAGTSLRRGRGLHREGEGEPAGQPVVEAGAGVPGADGGAFGGGAQGDLGRD